MFALRDNIIFVIGFRLQVQSVGDRMESTYKRMTHVGLLNTYTSSREKT
jgi:hypothetical protein